MNPSSQKLGIMQKTTRFLTGFLISLFTIAILLKLLGDFKWALSLGTALNGTIVYYIIKKKQKIGGLRIVAIGTAGGIIFMILTILILWIFVQAAFQDIAN